MPEKEGQAAASETTGATATETTLAPPVDAEGNLSENWREALDEDIRHEKCLETFKDIKGMAKTLVHARRMVGKNKIAIPGENATEDEVREYLKAAGLSRPETAADYGFAMPKDFPPELYNEELAASAMELFYDLGLTKKQADKIFEFNNAYVLKKAQEQQQQAEFEFQESENALYKEWGAARDQRVHFGNIAVQEGARDGKGVVDEDFKTRLTQKFGNDPDFIKYSSNLGSKFAEHGMPVDTNIPTPGDIQAKITEEMGKESYTNASHPNHANQVKLVQRLFEEKAKAAGQA